MKIDVVALPLTWEGKKSLILYKTECNTSPKELDTGEH